MWEVARQHISEYPGEIEGPFVKYEEAYALFVEWKWMNSPSWMIELRQDSQVLLSGRGTDDGRG